MLSSLTVPAPARYTGVMIVNLYCAGWAVREAAKPVRREDHFCEHGFSRFPAGCRRGRSGDGA